MFETEFSHQIAAYHEWKQQLVEKIEFYQTWLKNNNLNTFDIEEALEQGKLLVQNDQLTIAMVGEFSRGKTELINALLFSEFGQRILPSQAGRTTMCPTEIYFDQTQSESRLRLLPIETRLRTESIQQLKVDQSEWHEIEIDLNNKDLITECMAQLAATKEMDFERAKLLGFDENMLSPLKHNPGKVLVPVWRHALLSIDSPLLRKGLRFLDTPGLNALGAEPELTISMLPKAQAVIFLLSADTGVTASDMMIWKQFLDQHTENHKAGCFAVLNKIDTLWDDLQGDDHVAKTIFDVKRQTAEQLKIDLDDVVTVSAKQALIAKVKNDRQLLERSELLNLEQIIAQRILEQKESLICDDLVIELQEMIHGSMALLNQRLASMYERLEAMQQQDGTKKMVADLAKQSHEDHERYYKKLITLKSSRRLLNSQGEILQQIISPIKFKALLKKTRRLMHDSWSTLGLMHAMNQFFKQVEKDLENMVLEAQLADKMVAAIYQRFKVDIDAQHLAPKVFSISNQQEALSKLKDQLVQYCRQPKMFITEQSILTEHFFSTFANEAEIIQKQVYEIAMKWPDRALSPLMQYAQEQKVNLENQMSHLKRLANTSRERYEQQQELEKIIQKTEQELAIARQLQSEFMLPPRYLENTEIA